MKQQNTDTDALRFGTVRDPMHRDVLETRDIAKEILGLLDMPETDQDGPTTAEHILEQLMTLSTRMDALEESAKLMLTREMTRSEQHQEFLGAVRSLNSTLSGLGRTSGQQTR